MIVSFNNRYTDLIHQFVSNQCLHKIELNNFDFATSRAYIEKYLGKYNKRLDKTQMGLILEKSDRNKSPLWLSFICHELRIFGEFTTINKKINQLDVNLKPLITNILNRIDSDFGNNFVKEVILFRSHFSINISYNLTVCL